MLPVFISTTPSFWPIYLKVIEAHSYKSYFIGGQEGRLPIHLFSPMKTQIETLSGK